MIHLEILCFVYQWYHILTFNVLLITLIQYLPSIHIMHVNHRMISVC